MTSINQRDTSVVRTVSCRVIYAIEIIANGDIIAVMARLITKLPSANNNLQLIKYSSHHVLTLST